MSYSAVLIAKNIDNGSELFCDPTKEWGESGFIRTKSGELTPCCVAAVLEKQPFFLYDPTVIADPYRREVVERIQSGEAINDWFSGGGLLIAAVPPPPPEKPEAPKAGKAPKEGPLGKKI